MVVVANVQGIVIVNRSLHWISNCSVTSVGHASLFTAQALLLS